MNDFCTFVSEPGASILDHPLPQIRQDEQGKSKTGPIRQAGRRLARGVVDPTAGDEKADDRLGVCMLLELIGRTPSSE
jgi:hypothetical protein